MRRAWSAAAHLGQQSDVDEHKRRRVVHGAGAQHAPAHVGAPLRHVQKARACVCARSLRSWVQAVFGACIFPAVPVLLPSGPQAGRGFLQNRAAPVEGVFDSAWRCRSLYVVQLCALRFRAGIRAQLSAGIHGGGKWPVPPFLYSCKPQKYISAPHCLWRRAIA